jgi:YbgC/YbaW family acyl-CoA thioester hydrolase
MPQLSRADFRFFHRLRVRWAEVDMQKIVFNAHYLMYFDTAITDYWRAMALPYEEAMHSLAGDLYVVKATVEFHASARMDDQLDVAMKCSRIGNSSMTFTGAIFRGEEHLISGELVYVFADPATQTSRPVPQALRDILLGYEAGEAVSDGPRRRLGHARHRRAGGPHRGVRRRAADPQGSGTGRGRRERAARRGHNRLGQAVATGRLIPTGAPGVSQVGRWRSSGCCAAVRWAAGAAGADRGGPRPR